MNRDLMRPRHNTNFAAQGRDRLGKPGGGGGGGTRMVEGRFEAFYPRDVPCWINISPYSSYTYPIWDRDLGEIREVTTTWFEYRKHFVPRNRNRTNQKGKAMPKDFICSCGVDRSQPCWGCAVRNAFYKKLDAIEAKSGIRPKDEAPVSASNQFALGITIAERIYVMPVRDSNGSVRKTKNGDAIFRHIPAPFAEENSEVSELAEFGQVFGHRAHWSLGREHLEQLLSADDRLKSHCGNCAGQLMATHMICPSCETEIKLPEAVKGVDLDKARAKMRTCPACHEKTTFVPKYACPDCGDPKEGSLLSFDIRVMKEAVGDNKSVIHIVGVRMPGSPNPEIQQRLDELTQNPLKLDAIFAPTDLKYQKIVLGDGLTKDLSPVLKRKEEEEETESYAGDSEDDDSSITY